jgi:hypothetical protein
LKTTLTLSLTILIIFSSGLNYSQELGWGAGEIYVGTYQQASEQMISYRYRMTSVSLLWGGGPHANPPTSYILNPSNPDYQTAIATFEGVQFFTNTNFSGYNWPHFRIIRPDDININAFGYGLYKFSVDGGSAYFFIDYRDDNYGRNIYSNCPGNDCNDIWIKYESDPLDKFYYVRYDPDSEPGIDPKNSAWIPISNGQLLYYYKIKLQQSPSTDEFPDYWENCLAVINDGNNHPKLVWGPYPTDIGIYEYRIYRQYGGWHHFATVNSDQYMFVDTTVYINPPGGAAGANVYYYVKGVYTEAPPNPIETNPTNTVVINISGKQINKTVKDIELNETANFSLFQNYPNPFNPSTIINYSIAENSFVSLKIFDVLGTEVAELVNSNKAPGNYSVTFDASGVASGLYFYQLKASGYTITKKMLVAK